MKTSLKAGPDIADLINKMQEKLVVLEQKIDTLIGRPSSRPAEVKSSPISYQEHRHRHDHGEARNRNNFKERFMYKAICAECKQECEVPFKPTGGRPVYCKECFSKRRAGSSFNERPDNRPREIMHAQEAHAEKHHGSHKRRTAPKKKVFSKRRKKY
jgi:CxxC-x17-CxxC domain-containing protein